MACQMLQMAVTLNDQLKVIHQLQGFSNAIYRPFMQHFTRFQLTVYSRGPSAAAGLLFPLAFGTSIGDDSTPVEFHQDLWLQKTESLQYCVAFFVILYLAL